MNHDAMRAALRIVEAMPRERITTHEQKAPRRRGALPGIPFGGRKNGRPFGNLPEIRRERVRKLRAEGVSTRKIAVILGISRIAVQKHVRALRKESQQQ